MVITGAFLANYAEASGGMLYVAGGAWAWTHMPVTPAHLVLLFDTGPDDDGRTFGLVVHMVGPDGSEGVVFESDLAVQGRAMFGIFPFKFPTDVGPGMYAFRCEINGQDQVPAVFRLEVRPEYSGS